MEGLNFFFLCGPHCSGKTTILKQLYREGIISIRGSEIGKELFYQRNLTTAIQGAEYEFEVTQLELERDLTYFQKEGFIGVESWHPGNLAYAMVRNPDVVPQLIYKMKNSPLLASASGIRLHVASETIYKRTQTFREERAWAAEFYSRIENNLDLCLEQLDLNERIISIDANRDLNTVMENVRQVIINLFQSN